MVDDSRQRPLVSSQTEQVEGETLEQRLVTHLQQLRPEALIWTKHNQLLQYLTADFFLFLHLTAQLELDLPKRTVKRTFYLCSAERAWRSASAAV